MFRKNDSALFMYKHLCEIIVLDSLISQNTIRSFRGISIVDKREENRNDYKF